MAEVLKKSRLITKMQSQVENQENKKNSFMQWLTEDDSPEIGIATKEPLKDYVQGVKTEFKKISWPTREQAFSELLTVIVIVALITVLVFALDIGLDKVINTFRG